MTILTIDCLDEIFRYFKDDHHTLHSCILVNKSFCELVTPLLWNNPFKFIENIEKKILVIRTYLCFTNTNLPKPFIEYHKLLQEFELQSFQEGLRELIRHDVKLKTNTKINKKINKIIRPLNEQLGNLLLSKNNNLNHLDINYANISKPENQLNLCLLNDIDDVLTNISRLSLKISTAENYSEKLLEIFTKKRRNLQHLSLSIPYDHIRIYTIIKLLKSQHNLKSLEIPFLLEFNNNMTSIFLNFAHSLTSLKITNRLKCGTLFSLLDILHNLRKLEVSSLYFKYDDMNFLKSSIPSNQYYKLKYLSFVDSIDKNLPHPLYKVVFERIKAMSNIVIPDIYLIEAFDK